MDKRKMDSKVEGDLLLKMAKERGYVKSQCRLPGAVVMALMNSGENPCDRCNHFDCKNVPKEV